MKMNIHRLKRMILATVVKVAAKSIGEDLPAVTAAAAIIEKDGKILTINTSYNNGNALPGGALNNSETLEEGLEREVMEEVGLTIISTKYFGSYSANTDAGYWVTTAFFICKTRGKLRGSEEGEPEWLSKNEIVDKLIYKDNKAAVKDYLKK